ncbi:hypothetical protein Ddye_005077 [Dipteronia dyeriana]|uniref:DUF4283 domain-containing protein n=1 Tax=Dipteronia dyeriana TaxID=168575 RepID=A0AAD9XFL7_9ROSI|nr:hypothetical protein Ddye_005077 [Dipteronia dyeriana]
METDELERLCSALSIKELEGPVTTLDEGMKASRERKLALCMVGKVLTTYVVNKDAFIRVFYSLWKVNDGFEIELAEGNTFTFQFFNMEDRNRIINGGPWNFDRAMVFLEVMPLDGDIANLRFNKVEFWVQVHKIPPLCMSEEIGHFLGKMIGEVREVDLDTAREDNSRYLRIRVMDYCFKYKRIGHSIRECLVERDIKEVTYEMNHRLNVWLRTGSSPKKILNRYGRQKDFTRGKFGGTNHAKKAQKNNKRMEENWRNPKGQSTYGNYGDRMESTPFPAGQEKAKGPLVSIKSGIGARPNVVNNNTRGKGNGEAIIIDVGESKKEDKMVGNLVVSSRKGHHHESDEVERKTNRGETFNWASTKKVDPLKPMRGWWTREKNMRGKKVQRN